MNKKNSTLGETRFEIRESGGKPELLVDIPDATTIVFATSKAAHEASKAISDGAYALEKRDGTRAASDAFLATIDARDKVAQAVKCGFEGCDGETHEGGADPSEWMHRVFTDMFDNWEVDIVTSDDGYVANIYIAADGDMSADEIRTDAAAYEAFPAWLRMIADKVDALNAPSQ